VQLETSASERCNLPQFNASNPLCQFELNLQGVPAIQPDMVLSGAARQGVEREVLEKAARCFAAAGNIDQGDR
jgi:hypothetical protein